MCRSWRASPGSWSPTCTATTTPRRSCTPGVRLPGDPRGRRARVAGVIGSLSAGPRAPAGAAAAPGRAAQILARLRAQPRRRIDFRQWESPDDWLRGGHARDRAGGALLAVPTPGHTRVTASSPTWRRRLLFAGDHVLPHITPSIGFELVPAPTPLGRLPRSLRWCGPCPTCGCCRRTARSAERARAGRRTARPPRGRLDEIAAPASRRAPAPRTRSRACCAGPGAAGRSPSWTCSTRCWRSWRPSAHLTVLVARRRTRSRDAGRRGWSHYTSPVNRPIDNATVTEERPGPCNYPAAATYADGIRKVRWKGAPS